MIESIVTIVLIIALFVLVLYIPYWNIKRIKGE